MSKNILLKILNEDKEYETRQRKALKKRARLKAVNNLIELIVARLSVLENDINIRLDNLEKQVVKLEQLIRRSLHVEPPCYVSNSGLVRLPEGVIQELDLQDGGGLSFIPNKETGRYELWTTEQVEKELLE